MKCPEEPIELLRAHEASVETMLTYFNEEGRLVICKNTCPTKEYWCGPPTQEEKDGVK